MKNCLIVINRMSGRAAKIDKEKLLAKFGAAYSVTVRELLSPADEWSAEGYSLVVACGGDGTFNRALNRCAASGTDLIYYGFGTFNECAKAKGAPKGSREFIRLYEYAELNGRFFGYVAATGSFTPLGYTVDAGLIKQYKKHLADEEKRLFPNGRPPFSLTPPERAAEFVPTAEELAQQVKANDVAILTLGRTSGEASDRRVAEFYLKNNEEALIDAVAQAYHAVGKKVIVILNVCSAMETASWKDKVDAVLCAFQPGAEVGNCVADVLTGKVNPSGRLPMTFAVKYGDAPSDANFPYDYEFKMPDFAMGSGMNFKSDKKEEKPKAPEENVDYTNYAEGIYVGYRYFDTFGKEVSYPFGHGLSYTTFSFEVVGSSMDDQTCELQVSVKNTGKVAGKESVQLYVKAPQGGLEKPAKELKAFAKTKLLQPGESEVVTLKWNVMDMASFNEKNSSWQLAKGNYQWLVAASSADVRCTVDQKVSKAQKVKVSDSMAPEVKIAENPMVKR